MQVPFYRRAGRGREWVRQSCARCGEAELGRAVEPPGRGGVGSVACNVALVWYVLFH